MPKLPKIAEAVVSEPWTEKRTHWRADLAWREFVADQNKMIILSSALFSLPVTHMNSRTSGYMLQRPGKQPLDMTLYTFFVKKSKSSFDVPFRGCDIDNCQEPRPKYSLRGITRD